MSRHVLAPLAAAVAFATLAFGFLPLDRRVGADEPRPSSPVADPAAALEGGAPLPDGAWRITFPWRPQQSVSFVSDAPVVRVVGAVNFSDPGTKPLGTIALDGKGGGSGGFAITVADLSTLSPDRDEHLRGDAWLDAKRFPEITFAITRVERVRPTVYRVTGTWKMHGAEKELSALGNVRFVEKVEGLEAPAGVARVKATFSVPLKAFGVNSALVGSPAVADAWDVEMVVLGTLAKP